MTDLREHLRVWLRVNGQRPGAVVADHTPLFAEGIISSLQVMDLLLEIEAVTGERVAVERLGPGAFATLDAICRHLPTSKEPA